MNGYFRKTDCVFLIFCIISAIFITGAVGKRGQELNKRLICASNVRQLAEGLINAANDNSGIFPVNGGYWPWDVSKTVTQKIFDSIGTGGEKQDLFYCPANLPHKLNRNINWNYGGYRIVSYLFVLNASWNNNGSLPILGTGNKQWATTMYVDKPSETELVVDAILSQVRGIDPILFPNGNFGTIMIGGNPSGGIADMSNHFKTPAQPYGGNIGFVDGHVEWRPFEKMQLRHITYGNDVNGDPHWWW